MGFELAVQGLVYGALAQSSELQQLGPNGVGIYDHVPQKNPINPYVAIGEDSHLAWDTITSVGRDSTVTIHVWSRDGVRGMDQVKRIQAVIYDVLNREEFNDPNFDVVSVDFLSSRVFRDVDNLTAHGVQEFRILIDKNEV